MLSAAATQAGSGDVSRYGAEPAASAALKSPTDEYFQAYLKANPSKLQWDRVNIGNIGYNLVQGKANKYIKEKVASWDLDLEPRAMHFDKRITVSPPLQKAGAYYVTARMQGGNTCHIVMWL